jgi:hypothetical protein
MLEWYQEQGHAGKAQRTGIGYANDYMIYTMMDVPPLPDCKVVLPKGQFNGISAHYNIRMDPDLGMGWAGVRWVTCVCGPCKDQLQRPWVLRGNITAQPGYAVNKDCKLWPSYKGAKSWKIVALMPKTELDKKVACESLHCVLNMLEVCMSLMMCEGHVGAVSTTDKAAMGYHLIKWQVAQQAVHPPRGYRENV